MDMQEELTDVGTSGIFPDPQSGSKDPLPLLNEGSLVERATCVLEEFELPIEQGPDLLESRFRQERAIKPGRLAVAGNQGGQLDVALHQDVARRIGRWARRACVHGFEPGCALSATESTQPLLEHDHDDDTKRNQDDEQDRGRQVHGLLTIAAIPAKFDGSGKLGTAELIIEKWARCLLAGNRIGAMPDEWVRSPGQQAAIDLQATIDAQPRPDIVVRTYPGETTQAYADYRVDAAQMIPAGWHPIAQQYESNSPGVANVALFGLLAFAAKPVGSLVVTWQYQGPQSGAPAGGATEPEQPAGTAGSDPQAPRPG
jgi:hypothetical protein